MLFQFSFYSSLLLIFFVHAIVYACLLWYRSRQEDQHRGDWWLAFFLILSALYIAPWMLGFAGWYDQQPFRNILFYTPFQHLFWIGPTVYFYVQTLLNPGFKFSRKDALHFLPGLIYIVWTLLMFVVDQLILKRYYFLASESDPDFNVVYQVLGLGSMLFYFGLSFRFYRMYRALMVQVISYADTLVFRWIQVFLTAFLLMLGARLFFFILGLFWDLSYVEDWWYFLVFSLLTYFIAIRGYSNLQRATVPFRSAALTWEPRLLPDQQTDPVANWEEPIEISSAPAIGETTQEADPLLEVRKQQIIDLMEREKWYEEPTLSLSDLAKKLKTNPSQISRIINQGFSLNFNDFVNQYRIQAFQAKVKAGEHKHQTLLGVAYDCGFNSKATFNRAFKKFTGQNPKDWSADIQ